MKNMEVTWEVSGSELVHGSCHTAFDICSFSCGNLPVVSTSGNMRYICSQSNVFVQEENIVRLAEIVWTSG